MSKLFTIYGATGQQGGALIKYLLNHPRFSKTYKIRGVTQDVEKPSAKNLEKQGVEIVQGDMNDPKSLEIATQGSYAVFAVTNYWEKASRVGEATQGKAIADAAVAAGAQLLIWSSLPRIGLPNFESKADVEDYIRTLPVKSVFFMPGWFMQNHLTFGRPKKQEKDGALYYEMDQPWPTATSSTLVPLIDIGDIGKYLQPFLDDPEKYDGINLTAASRFYTLTEMCETWTKKTGTEVRFNGPLDESIENGNVARDSAYYGEGSKKALDWTLDQMEGKPNSWESFVEGHEPWFN